MDPISAKYILVSRIKLSTNESSDTARDILKTNRPTDDDYARSVYKHAGDDLHFVELVALDDAGKIAGYLEHPAVNNVVGELAPYMNCDIQRELIILKDVVKPIKKQLPYEKNMQMRYIEVPLRVMDEYHQWRSETIFQNVLKRDEITGFIAYHSAISMVPGVTFFVQYDCTPGELTAGFKGPDYQKIIKQAPKYVLHDTLSTRFYDLVYTSIGD